MEHRRACSENAAGFSCETTRKFFCLIPIERTIIFGTAMKNSSHLMKSGFPTLKPMTSHDIPLNCDSEACQTCANVEDEPSRCDIFHPGYRMIPMQLDDWDDLPQGVPIFSAFKLIIPRFQLIIDRISPRMGRSMGIPGP